MLSPMKYTVFRDNIESPQCADVGRERELHARQWGTLQSWCHSQMFQVMSACGFFRQTSLSSNHPLCKNRSACLHIAQADVNERFTMKTSKC